MLIAWFLPCTLVCAQTPFDAFSPETSRIILDGDSIAAWCAEQQSQLSHHRPTHSRPDTILCALIADLRNEQLLLVDIATHRPVAVAPFTDEIKNWLSVDPLVDKNISTSPYLYCNGNPIMFIDPDGRDDYSINENGEIQLFRKTNDKFDRLGTLNEDGSFNENNLVKLYDQTLLPGISANSEAYTSSQGDNVVNFTIGKYGRETAKLFLFAAENSNVEWNFCAFFAGGYRRYGVSTSHSDQSVLAAHKTDMLSISEHDLLFNIHSHCRENGTPGANLTDQNNLYTMYKNCVKEGVRVPLHYVYHVDSGNFYHYTPWNNYYIRNLKRFSGYTGLHFLIP